MRKHVYYEAIYAELKKDKFGWQLSYTVFITQYNIVHALFLRQITTTAFTTTVKATHGFMSDTRLWPYTIQN